MHVQRRAPRRRREGMTLVEIMIVVIIMALIATAVGMAVLPMVEHARIEQAQSDAATVRSAAELWRVDRGDCPTTSDLREGRLLNASTRELDPWDSPWSIDCSDGEIVVVSPGPDRQLGTEDDVPRGRERG